jgi:uncharacterized protein (DUF2267 family)
VPYPGIRHGMRYRELLDEARRAGVPEPVEPRVAAVLTTLGEELPAGTAGYLATNLPVEAGVRVRRATPSDDEGAHWDRTRFLRRVAERGGVPPDQAGEVVHTVLTAVSHGVPGAVMVDVAAAVPSDLLDLIPGAG